MAYELMPLPIERALFFTVCGLDFNPYIGLCFPSGTASLLAPKNDVKVPAIQDEF